MLDEATIIWITMYTLIKSPVTINMANIDMFQDFSDMESVGDSDRFDYIVEIWLLIWCQVVECGWSAAKLLEHSIWNSVWHWCLPVHVNNQWWSRKNTSGENMVFTCAINPDWRAMTAGLSRTGCQKMKSPSSVCNISLHRHVWLLPEAEHVFALVTPVKREEKNINTCSPSIFDTLVLRVEAYGCAPGVKFVGRN